MAPGSVQHSQHRDSFNRALKCDGSCGRWEVLDGRWQQVTAMADDRSNAGDLAKAGDLAQADDRSNAGDQEDASEQAKFTAALSLKQRLEEEVIQLSLEPDRSDELQGFTVHEWAWEFIVKVYKDHNPAKLGDVDTLLQKFLGKELTLCAKICNKYGVQPSRYPSSGTGTSPGSAQEGLEADSAFSARRGKSCPRRTRSSTPRILPCLDS